jgi:hypothetical protein
MFSKFSKFTSNISFKMVILYIKMLSYHYIIFLVKITNNTSYKIASDMFWQ